MTPYSEIVTEILLLLLNHTPNNLKKQWYSIQVLIYGMIRTCDKYLYTTNSHHSSSCTISPVSSLPFLLNCSPVSFAMLPSTTTNWSFTLFLFSFLENLPFLKSHNIKTVGGSLFENTEIFPVIYVTTFSLIISKTYTPTKTVWKLMLIMKACLRYEEQNIDRKPLWNFQ